MKNQNFMKYSLVSQDNHIGDYKTLEDAQRTLKRLPVDPGTYQIIDNRTGVPVWQKIIRNKG